MSKDELKKCLIAECEESNLTLKEISDALDATRMHFFALEEAVLKDTPIKIGQRTKKSERLSNFALGFSAFVLLIVMFIEFVMK